MSPSILDCGKQSAAQRAFRFQQRAYVSMHQLPVLSASPLRFERVCAVRASVRFGRLFIFRLPGKSNDRLRIDEVVL